MSNVHLKIAGIPRETCHYKTNPDHTALKVGCCDHYMVVQPDFHFCPYCGKPIECDPPPRDESCA